MQTVIPLGVKAFSRKIDDTILCGLAMALWLLALAWIRPLSNPDEGRYAVIALDMLRTGNWVTPHLNGLPFFHKPPLYYWLAATGYEVFGVHAWVARLPSMLVAWLASMSLLALARRYASTSTTVTTVIIFLTMPFTFLAAQYANMDMLLAGCMCACATCAFIATIELQFGKSWHSWIMAAGVFAGLGFLAKGLIGLVLPGLVWCMWIVWERRWNQLVLPLYPPAWLAILAIAGPWVWFAQKQHPQFFHYFFVTQHFQRYTETGFNNPQSWWFYLAVITLACLPWTLTGIYMLFRRWRTRQEFMPKSDSHPAQMSLDRYMVVWLLAVMAFFSIPSSKIVGYVLPALPPLAYLIARMWQTAFAGGELHLPQLTSKLAINMGVSAALCAALAIGFGIKGVPQKARWDRLAALPVQPDDRIMMLGQLYYGVRFYMHTDQVAWIVDDWQAAQASKSDNWRKELLDAADFSPNSASHLLLGKQDANHALCTTKHRVWVVGEPETANQMTPSLSSSKPMLELGSRAVWLWTPDKAKC
ncbi:glycosyltransferase family 39 protein [Comamonas testosteroni]|uniref:glycosyltransferase family 39 protein n=1 Tax=Comamonas testosteroni TaxID=285 RepID=UPI0023AA5E29|nr:glycosyltransferase family 39 protein [Comamonas testosteroni]WEE75388.1 glycosyltransferase family 39 protein [Comamonas testosteroni]